ncbi:MAG TPA: hypothetical protein VFL46_07080, partial [Phycicoccus sp.]|nr:hypothetical protein [Phycicoccus sp.]
MAGARPDAVRLALRAALDLVLPGACAASGEPGAPLCAGCGREVRGAFGRAPPVATVPIRCWSAVPLDGALRTAVSAYKDGGRRDLAPVLVTGLAAAVARAVREDPVLRWVRARGGRVLVVPVPPAGRARRRRGDDPVGALV